MAVGPAEFVRCLKAPSDPPVEGGPTKIEIAQDAWSNDSFYVPGKGEVISEWILTKLLKEKDRQPLLNSIFDLRYWTLLRSICGFTKGAEHRHLKTWLTPLLHRIPLGPVIVLFFTFLPDTKVEILAREFAACISILWPIAVQKMNTEMLLACFASFLNAMPLHGELEKVALIITASYRSSFSNSSNKKKLYQTFLQNHLQSLLKAQSKLARPEAEHTRDTLLSAGIDTLLSLDVLRQTYDYKPDSLLIQQLHSIGHVDRALVYEFIPVLFSHYIQALSKHRGAIFGQNSQLQPGAALDQLRQCSMNLFSMLLSLLSDQERDGMAWRTRLALLKVVNKENVFTTLDGPSQTTMHSVLDFILGTLSDAHNEDYQPTFAIQCLSMISRIDQDRVSAILPDILSRLLQIPVSSEPYFEFLDLLLNHHTKTRTMHVLIENFFESISALNIHHADADIQVQYQILFASAVMHDTFLEKVSKAILNFMTESQCVATTKRASEAVKNAWERAYDERKKPDSMDMDVGSASVPTRGESSAKFALITRLASVCLSALPTQALSPSILKEVRKSLLDFRSEVLHHEISRCLKKKKKKAKAVDVDSWAMEITLAALLRALYAINVSRNLSLPTEVMEKNHVKLLQLIPCEDLLPELTLEVFRAHLFDLSIGHVSNCEEIINGLLNFLEKEFSLETSMRWSGRGYQLTDDDIGRSNSSLAVLCMVIDRWLPEIDALACPEQLKRLLNIVMSIKFAFPVPKPPGQEMTSPEQLLLHTLHSAQFWEFRNIRNAFLDVLKNMTSESAATSVQNLSMSTLITRVPLYRLLLLFPMEYFSWQALRQLMNSALHSISAVVSMSDSLDKDFAEGVVIFRVFLKRGYGYIGVGGSETGMDYAELLLDLLKESPMLDAEMKEPFENAILDLAEVYLLRLLKLSKKNGSEALLRVSRTFNSESFGKTRTLSLACLTKLVNLLCSDFPANSVPEEVVRALTALHGIISSCIGSDVVSISEENLHENMEACRYADLAGLWYTLLRLGKWCSNGATPHQQMMTPVGAKIISVLMPLVLRGDGVPDVLAELCATAFAILLGELENTPEDERSRRLEVVLAMYVALGGNMPAAGLKDMDGYLRRTSKMMTLADYVHLLSCVANGLYGAGHSPNHARILSLVHVASLLLCDRPSHSLAPSQKFMGQCLGVFNDKPQVFVAGDSKLRLQVLEMVAQYCSNQHVSLRTHEMSMILLLISNFLAPSEERDKETQFSVFHKIVVILTSLIRLRRDLVSLSLPHLGLILRRLLLCLRGCRPNLGLKQTILVMNTQPCWISSTRSLGGEEAKALGRLLESLNVKHTVHIQTSTPSSSLQEAPKAESLARPFSKHAAYVLKAYIDALIDPLCVMSLDVRKELREGLFALCGMMSVHSRDALMVGGLDADEKAVLKSVWKEWETVKYIGQG